ncbi:class I SAM-dependent methyltransferase [Luteibacter sp. SG786]|uniref:class I SAM-dependent methyltransferase n=1 Tax=Luteibacter sp. SG786 TaxID=2587130 RepID=UPI00142489EB|nr:class I SAM-dependent methyltransferase [Luteibacter sp. SG786]NII54926.1 SAM-dependent methyltransferase [Luteibacter sp. SG786]
MHWRAKGVLQKVLGHVPGGEQAHYLLQRRFGGLRGFRREFDVKMDDWRLMVGHLRDVGRPIAGARLFEVGSGWYPTFPFACYLGGARQVVTVDLNRHIRPALVRNCAANLSRYTALIAEACGVPESDVRERQQGLLARLQQGDDVGAASEGVVVYEAPADATRTRLDGQQMDCVFSNSVLEHVLPEAIDGIYREAMRILAPGGIMFHSVNCGDHYAYVDGSINQLNYLQYSDRQWRRWDNAFLYQNRVRAYEFVERAAAVGFDIVLNTECAREKRLAELASMQVHPQFAHIPPERLCVTSIDFIGRKPGTASA